MRATNRVYRTLKSATRVLPFVAAVALFAGCGSVSSTVSCSADTDCAAASAGLFPDGGPMVTAKCCASACILPSSGCDSGFRYLTSTPAFGSCAPVSSCAMPQPGSDMSVSMDMSPMGDASADM